MAAYRYWSINITAVQGGSYSQLSILKFLSGANNLAVTAANFTVTGAYYSPFDLTKGGAPQNLNGDWVSANGNVPQRVTYDFGAPVSIDTVVLYAASDAGWARGPSAFQVQASTDNATWVVIAPSLTPAAWTTSNQAQTFATGNAAPGALPKTFVEQAQIEIVGVGRPSVAVTQSRLEVLGVTKPAALVSKSFLEALYRPNQLGNGPPKRRVFVAMT